jgi:hypothetical protein
VGLSGVLRVLAALAFLPLIAGCAGVGYREYSTITHTRYATIENFGDQEIAAELVDGLLEEVADLLEVALSPDKPKVRIMVTSPAHVGDLYRRAVTVTLHGAGARALYFPGASLVVIPHYERRILGHELAHYLTDHYLKSTPRRSWERIAYMVEDALPSTAPTVARRAPAPDGVATQAAVAPFMAPAN